MGDEWGNSYKLSSLCSKIGSGATPRGGSAVYLEKGKFTLIRSQNILDNAFNREGLVFIDSLAAKKLSNVTVEDRDLLLNITGDSVARCCLVDSSILPARVNQHVAIIRPDITKVNSSYLRYVFISRAMKSLMLSLAGAGATRNALTKSMIENLDIQLPSLFRQKQIADILGSLDDKIELNRQMNTTLEAMAQAMFKSWFVDFDPVIDNALAAGNPIPEALQKRAEARKALGVKHKPLPEDIQKQFPSSFVFSDEMGWIPQGWEVRSVGDILYRLKIGKRYTKKEVLDYGSAPVFEQGSSILLGYHNSPADIGATIDSPAFIFGDHTCVMGISIEPFSVSQNVIAVRGEKFNTSWVYYAIYGKQRFEEYRRHWMELVVQSVVVPKTELTEVYAKFLKTNLEKQNIQKRMNRELAKLRDTLLPKLISGELRIPNAEKLVSNAS